MHLNGLGASAEFGSAWCCNFTPDSWAGLCRAQHTTGACALLAAVSMFHCCRSQVEGMAMVPSWLTSSLWNL